MSLVKRSILGLNPSLSQSVFWLAISGAVRLIVCLAIHVYSYESGYNGFVPFSYGDDQVYWYLSTDTLDFISIDDLPNPYPLILSTLFQFTGKNLLAGKILNVVVSSLTVFFGVLISNEISYFCKFSLSQKRRFGNIVGALLTFFPSMLFLSGQLVKDPLTIFFGISNIYFSLLILFRKKYTYSFLWLITLLGIVAFRPYAGISVIFGILTYLGFVWESKPSRKMLLFAPLVIFLAFFPLVLGYGVFGSAYWLPWLDVQKLSELRESGTSIGNTAADVSLDFSNPITFIWTYSQSFVNVFLGPFPWQWTSPKLFLAVPETIFMWVIVFKSFKRLINSDSFSIKSNNYHILIIISLFLISTIALFNDNFGTTSRIRHLAWCLMIIYFSTILSSSKKYS